MGWSLTSSLLLIFVLYGSFASAQTGTLDAQGRPTWITIPKFAAAPAASNAELTIRNARDSMFDTPGATPLISHAVSDKSFPSGGGFDSFATLDSLPTSISDTVLVATASSFQPFLSADKSMVYSELTVNTIDVLKGDKTLVGKPVVILQRGGTLRFPNEEVVNSVPHGGSNPIPIATRCLLFLRYHPAQQAFTVLRFWDLSGAKPREMDNDGHPYIGRTNSIENDISSEADIKQRIQH